MSIFRRGRFLFWAARELSHKYTRFLFLGIVIGSAIVFCIYAGIPFRFIGKGTIHRIGYVGEYTTSTLPEDIQKKMSFGLTTISENGLPLPGIAEKWESTDSGKLYTFSLNKNSTWHNGKSVQAKDINYNIRGVTLSAPNPSTLLLKLETPFSPLLDVVSRPIFLSGFVGVGEYHLDAMQMKGDKISYLRLVNEKKLEAQVIEYRFYRSENQAMLAYMLGEVDQLDAISQLDDRLRSWPNTKIDEKTNTTRVVTLYFNLQNSLVADKNLRQALAYAIPDLPFERTLSPIQKQSWAYTNEGKKYPNDLTQAKKLFAKAEISSTSAELVIHTFSQYLPIAQEIEKSWNQLGIKTAIRIENVVPSQYQVLLSAFDIPTDPDQYVYWHSTQKATNITSYASPKIDKLLEDGRKEMNLEARKKLYIDFQKRLLEDIPALFLYYPKTYSILRK